MAEQHGKALVPQIRFAGFTDPWEQRKLGELSNEFKSGEFICADNVSVSGPYPVYGGNGLRGYTTTFNHEGLYTLIGRQGALCGNVNIADGKSYFTEHAVAVKANHLNDTTFLYYLFGTLDLGQYSGQSAQPGLAVSNLVEVEAMVPDKAEQKKISRVFKTVDSLITLHQRKLELLRNIKKSMLDKMFPKGGSLYPQIRFAGFTDPWEQRKLDEVASKRIEKNTNEIKETFTNSAEHGIVSQLDYFDHDITNDANIGNYSVVYPDDFVYNPRISTIAPCGPINRNKLGRNGVMSPLYTVFSVDDVINKLYLEYYFKTNSWHQFMFLEGNSGARSDRFSISDSTFFEMPIQCPVLEEQELIASFFNRLDSLITLHQRKLELLRNIKKSMLDKMFV